MKRLLVFGLLLIFTTSTVTALWWNPPVTYCSYAATPDLTGWYESFDYINHMTTCAIRDTNELYIRQNVSINRNAHYFTSTNPDMWTTLSYVAQSNIRTVEITFDYYAPSYNGQCTQATLNPHTGLYNSPQLVLVTNADSNLSQEGTFDDAFYQWNDEIVCDEWRTFSHQIREFENDYGSSFSGRSKTLGSIGFESKNIYLRNIQVDGDGGTISVWP